MKTASHLALLCAIFGLLCLAHAAPKQKRDLASMKDLIREIKAERYGAQAQEDNEKEDDAIAQLFLKVLEKEAKAESSDKLVRSNSIFSKLKNFFHRIKTKFHRFGGKVRRFFHRRRG